ncbi:3-carboxy-cis,cis-muconate cycloisomerase [Pelagibacterium halotolerans]|uniref:3-carboxy-cis,cis-muconate cycloisomerase n=1 Tax=Pelagibacterium halotolerans (strain DSM 22347 / JCM 15775 / CGMCC 1.7692 / B2) TaxID=1082931 RepID=G4RCS2_PELHB|nr:3-carboxy-cis,cis-muconate cycloisomerase [Pelagibacterium halotolerans]AEQ51727.1 3-carboxy-cis,cis-muconate cycloisomerase [Pelagibacterium halotolerans B2]QJR18453.1 3-carboxy-cis,cis-muconate cycloisomerase [Pelagibacterium halotolerans]SEA21556.1 3-carboxy-cis,cis-muconate cycloisomerase [Pelagibacterium halotolerans]
MSLSAFDHPILSGLFGDPELAELLSARADVEAMVAFEMALAQAQAECGIIPLADAGSIARLADEYAPDFGGLRAGLGRDGVVAPELVKQMRKGLDSQVARSFHFGATSQDVIDTSLVIRLKSITTILASRIAAVETMLADLSDRFGDCKLMARTRMQDALEISVADRIADWSAPLVRHRLRLEEIKARLLVVQYGGAVGVLEKLGEDGSLVTSALASRLGLGVTEKSWHNQRDSIVEFAGWLGLVSGSLGKMGQDIALMAQNAVGDVVLAGGGGSSAMPHKSNPVSAEVLVTLARYTAGSSGILAQSLVHEQERSGAAWTLEWLVLPQMIMATGSSLLIAVRLLDSIQSLGQA